MITGESNQKNLFSGHLNDNDERIKQQYNDEEARLGPN